DLTRAGAPALGSWGRRLTVAHVRIGEAASIPDRIRDERSPKRAPETRMSRPTHVYIVASPRPRSGKTLLARALSEFFRADGRPVRAFDLDTMDGALRA